MTFSQRETSPAGRDNSKYIPMRSRFGGAYNIPDILIDSFLIALNSSLGNIVISATGIKFTKTLNVPKCCPDLASTSMKPSLT